MIISLPPAPSFRANLDAPSYAPYGVGSVMELDALQTKRAQVQTAYDAADSEAKRLYDIFINTKKAASRPQQRGAKKPSQSKVFEANRNYVAADEKAQALKLELATIDGDIAYIPVLESSAVDIAKEINDTLQIRANSIMDTLDGKSKVAKDAAIAYETAAKENLDTAGKLKKEAIKAYNSFANDIKELQDICNQMQENASGNAYIKQQGVNSANNSVQLSGFFDSIGDIFKKATDPFVKPVVKGVKAVINDPMKLINPVAHIKGLYEAQKDVIGELRDQRRFIHANIKKAIQSAIGEKAYKFTSNIAKKATPYAVIAVSIVATILTAGAATPLTVAAIAATTVSAVTGQVLKDVAKKNEEDMIEDYTKQVNEVISLQQQEIERQRIHSQGNSVYTNNAPGRSTSAYGWYDKFSCWIGFCPEEIS